MHDDRSGIVGRWLRGSGPLLLIVTLAALLISLPFTAVFAEPTAEFPRYTVGDTWTFDRTQGPATHLTVVALENDMIVMTGLQQCPRCRAYLDRNLAPIKLMDESGKALASAPGLFSWGHPGWRYMDWPLAVKKTWRIEADGVYGNRLLRYTIDIAVQAFEEVTTRAGTFEAFRLSRRWQSGEWQMSETLWWSPRAKWYVKRTGEQQPDWELRALAVR